MLQVSISLKFYKDLQEHGADEVGNHSRGKMCLGKLLVLQYYTLFLPCSGYNTAESVSLHIIPTCIYM